ncbi:hypothetical protein [Microbacterium sp. GXF0217]
MPASAERIADGMAGDAAAIVTHHFGLGGTAEALMVAKTEHDSMKAIIHPQA